MRNDFRQFFVHDLYVRTRKAGAALPNMATLASIWDTRRANNTASIQVRTQTATLLIGDSDIDVQNQCISLLIRVSDTVAPNAVYSNPVANQFHEYTKQGTTGSDFGIHVIISIAPEQGWNDRYTCIIERSPNLRPDHVKRLLSKLLHMEYAADPNAFQYPHPGGQHDAAGNVKMERCRPFVDLHGRPSDDFIHDIQNGTLTGISMVQTVAHAPVGAQQFLVEDERVLKLSVDHGNLPANIWAGVLAAIGARSAAYPQATVNFRLPGRTRAVSVRVDSATGAPLEDLYIRSFDEAGIFPFLADSSETILPQITARIKPRLLNERAI